MTDHPSQASARYFDDLAERWDGLMPVTESVRRMIESTLTLLDIRSGETVLDAGCGTGVLFPFLLPLVIPGGRVIGLDVSPEMIERAARKHTDPGLTLTVGDIASFLRGRPAGSISAVTCFQAFPHFDDKPGLLKEFYRVLKPGGRFVVFHAEGSAGLNDFHATLPPPVNAHRLPSAHEVAISARDAGFGIVEERDERGLYLVLGRKTIRPD